MDDHHTLNIWDWRRGKILATARGHGYKIFNICFSPASGHSPSLITCGVKHIKFWTVSGNSLSGKKGVFGRKGEWKNFVFKLIWWVSALTKPVTLRPIKWGSKQTKHNRMDSIFGHVKFTSDHWTICQVGVKLVRYGLVSIMNIQYACSYQGAKERA